MLALLRETALPRSRVELLGVSPDPEQAERSLAGLLADGLVEQTTAGWGLPS
jgi:hypothetical protein